jgi:hypothetical protein
MTAVLGAAFVGTVFAASPIDGIGGNDAGTGTGNSAPSTSSTGSPLSNGLTNVEMPKIGSVAYVTKRHDHDGLDCHGLNGKSSLPGSSGHLQHPAQCKKNSVAHGKADIAGVKL